MRIINYAQGLSTRRFALEEVQPIAALPYAAMTNAVREKYSFMSIGASAEAQQLGLLTPTFEHGQFTVSGEAHAIPLVEIGPEGLRVMSSKTEIADAFIEDLFLFVSKEFGFRPDAIRKPPMYASTLLIELEDQEKKIFTFLQRGAKLIQEEFLLLKKERDVEPFGVRWLTSDKSGQPGTIFVLEKRLGNEAGENIFLSQASLPTAAHERYLKRLLGED